jgi:hypothetical protein
MAEIVFNRHKKLAGDNYWASGSLVFRCLTFSAATEGTTNNPDRNFVNDVILGANGGTENTGTGYTRKDCTSRTSTQDDTNNRAVLSLATITWTGANWGTTVALGFYQRIGADDTTPADDPLVAWYTTGFPVTTNGGDLSITLGAAGAITIS